MKDKPEMVAMPDFYQCPCGMVWDWQKVRKADVDHSLWQFSKNAKGLYLIECPECIDGERIDD